jgi:hypothetical protein
MSTSVAYIALSIAILVVISILLLLASRGKREKRLTPVAGLAFGLILAGIFFGEDRLIGYSLLGVGVVLAIVDIVYRLRKAA